MQGVILALIYGMCSSLPTNAQGGPFVLDLTGGAAQPGQVIGQVDGQTGNVMQPDVLIDPIPPSQSRVGHIDPIHPSEPRVGHVDPIYPADPGVIHRDPIHPSDPLVGHRDPIHPSDPGVGHIDPIHPSDPGVGRIDPINPSDPGVGRIDPIHPSDPGVGHIDPNLPSEPRLGLIDLPPAPKPVATLPVDAALHPLPTIPPVVPRPQLVQTIVPHPGPYGTDQLAVPVPDPAPVGLVHPLPGHAVDPIPIGGGPTPPPPSINAIDWTCEGYRSHPSNNNMYQVFYNNQWSDYSCFGILVWNQTLCSCIVPADTGVVDPNCPNNRAHPTDPTLYHIKHWGVWITEPKQCPLHQLWNQTGCRCDWDPVGPGGVFDAPVGGICDLMFNATFTNSLRDDANYNSIGRDPWFNVKVENGTARLDNGRMPVWAFASNDFGRDFQVQMDFKVDNIPANTNRYTTLVSNDCEYDRASVGVSYRPVDQSYKVFFKDTYLNSTLECRSPTVTPYAIQSISLEYQSSRLCLKVNGVICVESNNFGGDVAISRCPFYFGGDGRQQYMTGNLDDVMVRRFCVVPA